MRQSERKMVLSIICWFPSQLPTVVGVVWGKANNWRFHQGLTRVWLGPNCVIHQLSGVR